MNNISKNHPPLAIKLSIPIVLDIPASGVPQGSVLFALVIDSFTTICKNSVVFEYADGITNLHAFSQRCC